MTFSTIKFPIYYMLMFVFLCSENNVLVTSSGAGDHQVIICKETEREAVLTIKKGLTDDDDRLSSWGNDEHHRECCQWWGVTCSNRTGSVIALDLQNGEFGGQISPALLELPQLSYLNLNRNNFMGSRIPEFIGSVQNLEHLHLAYSNFSGDVPDQLGNLTNLQTLNLGHNYHLTSKNLTWLSNLSLLSSLDLSNNNFLGPVPDLKASLLLTELHLSNNYLTKLPSSIGQLSNLEILDVSYNSLQGTLTEIHFSKLHNLTILDLSFNLLVLNFTPDWLPPFQLSEIYLARCNVGPRFPSWLRTQTIFDRLDLSSAGISDVVPNWFWDKSQLIGHLNLSDNQIIGSIPDLSSNFINTIDLSSNYLSGSVPSFHSYFFKIQLSNNKFNGSIKSICSVKFDFLELLDLSLNQFSGELPNCWPNMTKLFVLNLRGNYFSGHLPHTLGSLKNLQALIFSDNNFTGELPSTLKNCEFLHIIDVQGNNLTGNVPMWMGQLKYLGVLILRQNNFHGNIPLEICSLKLVQILDLSENNISGKIPPCYKNFTYMVRIHRNSRLIKYDRTSFQEAVERELIQFNRMESGWGLDNQLTSIDLSSNKLVGKIPDEVSSLAGLIYLNLSHNHLTGNIISEIGQMERLEALDLSRNQLSGQIPAGFAELHYLSILNLSSNNLAGKIPQGNQLQTFDSSIYADNKELCGPPLTSICPRDEPRPSAANGGNQGGFRYVIGVCGINWSLYDQEMMERFILWLLSKIGYWLHLTVTLCITTLRGPSVRFQGLCTKLEAMCDRSPRAPY